MLRRKLHESLTVRIFLITLLILLGAGAITFALIAWATPITYTAAASDDLRAQTDLLVERLSVTALEDCGPILDEFIRASKSSVMLVDANGHIVQDTNSQLSIQSVYEDESTIVTVTSDSMFTASEIQSLWNGDPPAAIIQEDGREYALSIASDTQVTEVTFPGGQTCELYVSPGVRSENLAVAALARMAPLGAAGAAGLLCPVRSGLFPLYHPPHRPPQRHCGENGRAGLWLDLRGRPAGMRSAPWAAVWIVCPSASPPP